MSCPPAENAARHDLEPGRFSYSDRAGCHVFACHRRLLLPLMQRDAEIESDEEWLAQREVRERAIETELKALRARRVSRPWAYRAERVWVRSGRILFGLVAVAIGIYIIELAPNIFNRPLASLTLGELVGGVGCVFLGGWFLWIGVLDWAFGPGPTAAEEEETLLNEATTNVGDRARDAGGRG